MARYPDLVASDEFVVENLIPIIPDVYVKGSTTDRNTTTTLANDPDLAGIALPTGTFWIRLFAFFTAPTSTTPKLKTAWAFTGTWNNPIRACNGPGGSNVGASTDIAEVNFRGIAATSGQVYNVAASSAFTFINEETFTCVVTAAGNLSFQWAQNVSNAANISVKVGSAFIIKQIA